MEPTRGTLYKVLHRNARSGRMVPCRKPHKCDPARPHYVRDHNIILDVDLDAITASALTLAGALPALSNA